MCLPHPISNLSYNCKDWVANLSTGKMVTRGVVCSPTLHLLHVGDEVNHG